MFDKMSKGALALSRQWAGFPPGTERPGLASGLLRPSGDAMELLFRKHFWVVHALFLFLAMMLVARTVNVFVEAGLAQLPSAESKAVRAAAPVVVEPIRSLSLDRLAELLGLPKPEPEPEVKEPEPAAEDLTSEPVRTSLRLKLLGTLVSSDPRMSVASIQDVATLKPYSHLVGDVVAETEAKVLEVQRTRVIILNNNRREFIDETPGDGSSVAAYTPPPVAAPTIASRPVGSDAPKPQVLGAGIRALSENEYEVPRAEIDRTLSNLNDVAMQARIVPAFKDGVAQGFKLFSIRPDSIYSKIGVQNGDVIKRINGYDMNSPEKAMEVYLKLKEASRIDIEIERGGSVVRKTYSVR